VQFQHLAPGDEKGRQGSCGCKKKNFIDLLPALNVRILKDEGKGLVGKSNQEKGNNEKAGSRFYRDSGWEMTKERFDHGWSERWQHEDNPFFRLTGHRLELGLPTGWRGIVNGDWRGIPFIGLHLSGMSFY
jgi:hypothetical protein